MKIYEIISEALPPRNNPGSKGHSKKRSIANDVATFMGKDSKTWNKGSNQIARKMSDAGKTPEEIWAATGNWMYAGTWKQEINDFKAKFKKGPHDGTLGDQLDHKDLYKAYSAMKGYNYNKDVDQSKYSGSFTRLHTKATDDNKSGKSGEINISKFSNNPMAVTGHEVQHAASNIENWPSGGSPRTARTKAIAKKLGVTPREAYKMYADEILSNITMDRWNWTDKQRKATMPDASATSHIISGFPKDDERGTIDKISPNTHTKPVAVNPVGTTKPTDGTVVWPPKEKRKSWMKPGHNYDASTGGSIFDGKNNENI